MGSAANRKPSKGFMEKRHLDLEVWLEFPGQRGSVVKDNQSSICVGVKHHSRAIFTGSLASGGALWRS